MFGLGKKDIDINEEIFKILVNSSNDLITVVDDKAKIIWANKAWKEVFGKVKGRANPFKGIHTDDVEAVTKAWKKLVSTGKKINDLKYRYKVPSGKYLFISTDAERQKVGGKFLTYITAHNITKQKLAEEKYRVIVENSQEAVMLTRLDGVVTYLNPAAKEVLGYDPAKIVGTVPDVVYSDDKAMVSKALRRAKVGQAGSEFEYRIVTAKGKIKWISHSWSLVNSGGTKGLILSVIADITKVKTATGKIIKAERDSSQALEKYKLMFNISRDVVIQIDSKGKIIDINDRVFDYGYKKEDLVNKNILKLSSIIPKKWWPKVGKAFTSRMRGKEISSYEIEIKDKKGKLHNVEIIPMSIKNHKGKAIGAFVSIQDITGRIKSQKELKNKLIELEKINELMVGREIKMIELKNKLNKK